jgi:hypothetical protein
MATALNANSVMALLNMMQTPLLTFAVTGHVAFSNEAAKNHTGKPVETLNEHPVIKRLIADATLGKIKLPYSSDIQLNDGEIFGAKFMPGPAGLDVACIITHYSGEAGAASRNLNLDSILGMLKYELVPPAHDLAKLIEPLARFDDEREPNLLELSVEDALRKLERFEDIIFIYGDEPKLVFERAQPELEIGRVVRTITHKAEKANMTIDVQYPAEKMPMVNVSRRLFQKAVWECLDNAILHAKDPENPKAVLSVDLSLKMSGEYMLITICNKGPSVKKIDQKTTVKPFALPMLQTEGWGQEDGLLVFERSEEKAKNLAPEEDVPNKLGLSFVQQVVKLHGGRIRLNNLENHIVQLMLEIPIGEASVAEAQVSIKQAHAYAKELAKLKRSRK